MVTAVTGLGGVIIGALISAWTSWLLGRRREKQDIHAAIRLICTDLHKIRAIIQPVRDHGDFGEENSELPLRAFGRHAETVAKFLGPQEWKLLEGAILGVERMEDLRMQVVEEGRKLRSTEVADFCRIGDHIDKTIKAIDKELNYIDHRDGYQAELWKN